jgi:ankyrin repeat protein
MNMVSLLNSAVKKSSPDVVMLLLDDPRVDPNAKHDIFLETSLYCAVQNSRSEIIKVLLEDSHVDLSIGRYELGREVTPFGSAVAEWNPEIMRLLIENPRFDPELECPLHQAVKTGSLDMVRELTSLERIRHILGLKDDSGRIALEVADANDYSRYPVYAEIANLLRNAGAE